jgi:hypothetical protein
VERTGGPLRSPGGWVAARSTMIHHRPATHGGRPSRSPLRNSPSYGVFIDEARLVLTFFVVELFRLEAVFLAVAVLFVRVVPVAFVALLRVVPVLVFLTVVEVRPLADDVWDASSVSPVGATFLRVPRLVAAPSC